MYLNAICDTPCHVFKIPVTYKIRQTDSDFIFLHARPEIMSCFGCKLFCNKDIFSDYLFILWNSHHACLWKYFFPTYLRLNNIKKKRVATQFCTQHFFFFISISISLKFIVLVWSILNNPVNKTSVWITRYMKQAFMIKVIEFYASIIL